MFGKRPLCALIGAVLALSAVPVGVASQGDAQVDIEYEPEDLVMDPDHGYIHFDVTNRDTEPVEVAFSFRADSDPSDLRFRFSLVNQVLAPARTLSTDLRVWRDDLTVGVKDDRFTVTVVWGADLGFLPNGSADPATVESSWETTFEVLDDYPDPYGPVPFCILGLLIAVLAVILLYPGWVNTRRVLSRGDKGREP
jgi:hypothetical protein